MYDKIHYKLKNNNNKLKKKYVQLLSFKWKQTKCVENEKISKRPPKFKTNINRAEGKIDSNTIVVGKTGY